MKPLRKFKFSYNIDSKLLLTYVFVYMFYGQFYQVYCAHNTSENYRTTAYSARNVENVQGFSLREVSDSLAEEMDTISTEELGLAIIEKMYKSFTYTSAVPDVEKIIRKIVAKLSDKLDEMFNILDKTNMEIIENYKKMVDKSTLTSAIHPCLYSPFSTADHTQYIVNKHMINPNNSYSEDFQNFAEVFEREQSKAKHLKVAIKQQYFLSSADVGNNNYILISRCDMHDDTILWKSYMSWLDTPPRRILLLLDHGGSLSSQQIKTVKAVAKQIISVLNPTDKVGVLALSDEISSPYFTENCLTPNQPPTISNICSFAPATLHNKEILYRFIDTLLKGNGATNHSLGFQLAFEALKMSAQQTSRTTMLLYVSRGLLSSLTEPKTVLETIANGLQNINCDIVINTCAVVDDTKPIVYEMHFLRDIVHLNFTKYNLDTPDIVNDGIMLSVNSSRGVGLAAARFLSTLDDGAKLQTKRKLSLPTWDNVSKDLTIMASIPCGENGELGILGIDVFLSDLVEDVTYYTNHLNYTHAFIMTLNGTVIMHPSYPRPISASEQLEFVDVSHLEKVANFTHVRHLLLNEPKGQYKLQTSNHMQLKYVWRRVQDRYIVCIVIRDDVSPPIRPHKVSWYPGTTNHDLVHHRLDLLPSSTMCLHLKQLSTINAGSLFLSASCFQSPFSYVLGANGYSVTPLKVQSYMAYLKDTTRLLANPGLKEEVRDDVAALAPILDYLGNKHLRGARARYVVRRYLTAPSGVMLMFPGGVIPATLEPTRRTWFVRATEHRRKLIVTPPYLDAGGAGYIATAAVASAHAVSAMDVTYGYVYKLMLQAMPFCTLNNIKCFMMDDRGYLIYHPNLIDPNGRGPIEQQHIIHKESLLANDILNHERFVKKTLCNNYADGTIQRYYKLNTSVTDTLTNVVHGEHCVKYHVTAVPGTNLFVGVVNSTCDVVATFCPCSMVDRLCLNCNRMEQTECECPCECPLNLDTCAHPNVSLTENRVCADVPEQAQMAPNHILLNFLFKLKPCLKLVCDVYDSYDACLGVVGCEWCQLDVDGETALSNPFCTSIKTCFNGVLGSVTPYGDVPIGAISSEVSAYSPVGPVAGSLLALFVALGLLFYCYRHYASDRQADGAGIRMSHLDVHDDFHEDLDNHQDKLLQVSKKAQQPLSSPYCVSSGYRRATPAADSDHGYSTMTPHEESEHLSFALIELESLEDDFNATTSDAASTNTSVSAVQKQPHKHAAAASSRSPPPAPFTQVPPLARNSFLAPVTVHRHMETM